MTPDPLTPAVLAELERHLIAAQQQPPCLELTGSIVQASLVREMIRHAPALLAAAREREQVPSLKAEVASLIDSLNASAVAVDRLTSRVMALEAERERLREALEKISLSPRVITIQQAESIAAAALASPPTEPHHGD